MRGFVSAGAHDVPAEDVEVTIDVEEYEVKLRLVQLSEPFPLLLSANSPATHSAASEPSRLPR